MPFFAFPLGREGGGKNFLRGVAENIRLNFACFCFWVSAFASAFFRSTYSVVAPFLLPLLQVSFRAHDESAIPLCLCALVAVIVELGLAPV